MSYSQLGQDVHLINDIYKGKKNGYFIEIGAYDGKYLSNTYLLETTYEWKGICIEPLPDKYELLKKNRSVNCINVAAYNEDGKQLKFLVGDVYSGISTHIDRHYARVSGSPAITVETKTLTTILNENNAPTFIEYLSIDTEGSELKVLEGIDFDKYKFGYISLEHNYVEPRRQEIKNFLKNKGYNYHRENQWDDDFILADFDKFVKNS